MDQQENRTSTFSELSYAVSFLFVTVLQIFGFALQWFVGSVDITLLRFPVNVIIVILLLSIIVLGHFKFKKSQIVRWLSSTKAAISSIVGFSFISVLMGFISQEETTNLVVKNVGLNAIASSWAYLFSLLYLIIVLGFATIKRIFPFKKQNFWYILNHLGLWIVLIAANFGYPDTTHLRMDISASRFTDIAYDINGNFQVLPFEIKQKNFYLENYNPKLTDNNKSMADTLIRLQPTLKEVSLNVCIQKNEKQIEKTIAVNKPQNYNGWKIYLYSFNEQKGKQSNTSVIELIKEPWQPIVFLGLGMLILGSLFVFWRGKK